MHTETMAFPPLPSRCRDRVEGQVYTRGDEAILYVGGRIRPACRVCGRRATFGMLPPCPGRRCQGTLHCGPRWCRAHAPVAARDVANPACAAPGCQRQICKLDVQFCGRHRVLYRHCDEPDCTRRPASFKRHCSMHARQRVELCRGVAEQLAWLR